MSQDELDEVARQSIEVISVKSDDIKIKVQTQITDIRYKQDQLLKKK